MADFNFLNSPDFGAPGGVRANTAWQIGQLEQLKTLGEIGMQPARAAELAAHTRYLGAEAATKEAAANQTAKLNALSTQAFAQGGSPGDTSLAAPLENLVRLGYSQGLTTAVAPLATKAMQIRVQEGNIAASAALAQKRQYEFQREQLDRQTALLATASDQQTYDRMRLIAQGQGMDVSALPEDYASAKPMLEQAVTAGMKVKDQLHARIEAANQASLQAHRSVQNATSAARADEAKAHTELLKERTKNLRKNGGDGSPSVKASRDALTAQRQIKNQAALDKAWPLLTPEEIVDPAKRVIGAQYRSPAGTYAIWTKDGWVVQPKPRFTAGGLKPGVADEAETLDDSDDEENE